MIIVYILDSLSRWVFNPTKFDTKQTEKFRPIRTLVFFPFHPIIFCSLSLVLNCQEAANCNKILIMCNGTFCPCFPFNVRKFWNSLPQADKRKKGEFPPLHSSPSWSPPFPPGWYLVLKCRATSTLINCFPSKEEHNYVRKLSTSKSNFL